MGGAAEFSGPAKENKMGFKVAVVGATGNLGREMLDILAERRFPA
ncbi:MAG TPA: aspartate-semialdehyde dehydrogenase, partial [Methylovirgula sp.]